MSLLSLVTLLQLFIIITVVAQVCTPFQGINSAGNSFNNPPPSDANQPQQQKQPQQQERRMRSAWHCHGRNQRELVQNLIEAGIIRDRRVAQVMTLVDRKFYTPRPIMFGGGGGADAGSVPYMDAPQSIGHGQTISAPHMHAHVLEEMLPHLVPKTSEQRASPVKILDVGCGSGYLTAALGRLVHSQPEGGGAAATTTTTILGRPGRVYGVDIYPELVARSKQNILSSPMDKELLDAHTIELQVANGWDGLPQEAPFDAIHVGAAAEDLPKALARQLKVGGVLIVPIGPQGGAQVLYKIERTKPTTGTSEDFNVSDYRVTQLLGVQYVPLVKELR